MDDANEVGEANKYLAVYVNDEIRKARAAVAEGCEVAIGEIEAARMKLGTVGMALRGVRDDMRSDRIVPARTVAVVASHSTDAANGAGRGALATGEVAAALAWLNRFIAVREGIPG